jgi:hypothetical protein
MRKWLTVKSSVLIKNLIINMDLGNTFYLSSFIVYRKIFRVNTMLEFARGLNKDGMVTLRNPIEMRVVFSP